MRNIIMITFDSLRRDHCNFLGYERENTPFLSKIANKSLVFENMVTSSLPTTCSMYSIFSGKYPRCNSVPLMERAPCWRRSYNQNPSIAKKLSEKGYKTIAFHANPAVSEYFGVNSGFYNFNYIYSTNKNTILEKILRPTKKVWVLDSTRRVLLQEERAMPWERYYDQISNSVKDEKDPFFLWVLLVDTHVPYIPPKEYRKWGSSNYLAISYVNWKISRHTWRNNVRIKDYLSDWERELLISSYDNSIYYSDHFVERIIEDFRDYDPVVIVHSDHGEGFGEHDFYWHPSSLYEELINVPFLIYNADQSGNVKEIHTSKELHDFILAISDNNDSHIDFFKQERGYAFTYLKEDSNKMLSIKSLEWKYKFERGKGSLFDLREDPMETYDVSNKEKSLFTHFDKNRKEFLKSQNGFSIDISNL